MTTCFKFGVASAMLAFSLSGCGGSDGPAPAPTPAPSASAPATAASAPASAASAPVAQVEKLRLIAFNDFHGHLEKGSNSLTLNNPNGTGTLSVRAGGAEYLAGYVKQLRQGQTHSFVVSSGDAIGGSPLASAFFRDEPTFEIFNSMGVDFNVVGNHEFDKGVAELRRMVAGGCSTDTSDPNLSSCASSTRSYAGARFATLAANVTDATGRPIFQPYVIRQVGTQRIAFVGAVTRTTPNIVTPAGVAGLTFGDEATAINRYVAEIKAQGVKAIVAVVHEGGLTDATWNDTACTNARGSIFEIVDKLDAEVDVVLSAHTHQGYNCVRNGMRVMQAFSFGRGVSRLDLEIRADGQIDAAKTQAQNLPVVNDLNTSTAVVSAFPVVPADPAVKRIADEYIALAAPKANREVGQITATIDRTASAGGDHAAGRLIADAQLAATSSGATGSATIAFMNPGGVRADFTCSATPTCAVSFGAAFTVQPFANSLVVMSLTGAQVKELLEQQFSGVNAARPRILQPSAGFTYSWDNSAAVGSKISLMRLNGQAIDPARSYRVTVNSFLAEGGDGFAMLTQGTQRLGGAQDIDALIAYLAANRPYAPVTAARITRLN